MSLLAGRASVTPAAPLRGALTVPGDKSISHRALLFAGMAEGTSTIHGLSLGEDVGRTREAVRALGARIGLADGGGVTVTGGAWREVASIDCGNSGTTARLMLGALAGRAGARLVGDASLSRRPMRRVLGPLRAMGARILPDEGASDDHLPLTVVPAPLRGITRRAEVPSAQVKSAVLLAGLQAEGETTWIEPVPTRDHTERLLRAMGAALEVSGEGPAEERVLRLRPGPLQAREIEVPGDLSAAAFWLVAAAIVPGSRLTVRGVGLNPTRAGVLAVLRRMGAAITVVTREGGVEPLGDVTIEAGPLRATEVSGPEVPLLIDEIPVLAVAAALAEGRTVFRDAAELRVKESDRVATTVAMLRALGVAAEARPDGLVVEGGRPVAGSVSSQGDHRVAMAGLVAGLVCGAEVLGTDCIPTSYPDFLDVLGGFSRVVRS